MNYKKFVKASILAYHERPGVISRFSPAIDENVLSKDLDKLNERLLPYLELLAQEAFEAGALDALERMKAACSKL